MSLAAASLFLLTAATLELETPVQPPSGPGKLCFLMGSFALTGDEEITRAAASMHANFVDIGSRDGTLSLEVSDIRRPPRAPGKRVLAHNGLDVHKIGAKSYAGYAATEYSEGRKVFLFSVHGNALRGSNHDLEILRRLSAVATPREQCRWKVMSGWAR